VQLRAVLGSSQLPSLPSRTGWWPATRDAIQGATAPSARSADQQPTEAAVWNHPIRVTTVQPAGSRVSTTVTPGGEGRERGRRRYPARGRGRRPPPPPPARPSRSAAARRPDGPGPRPPPGPAGPCRPAPPPVTPGPPHRTGAGAVRPTHPRSTHSPPEAATSSSTRPQPGHRDLISCPSPSSRRRSPPRRAAGKAGRSAVRPRLASPAGHWRMRGQPGEIQTWRAASTVSTPQVPPRFRTTDGCPSVVPAPMNR
jgi:hypothetical protein